MTNNQIFRSSGIMLLIGAFVFIVHLVLRSVITAGVDPTVSANGSWWAPVNLLGVVGSVLVLIGLPAVYAWMAARFGLSGLIGIILLAIAWMFIGLFLSLYSVLVMPWLADMAPSLIAASAPLPVAFLVAFAIGLLAWFAGSILLAIPFIRKQAQPTWVGYALIASAIWMIVGNFIIAPGGPASNLAVNLLSNLGPVFLLIGMANIGYRMSSENARTVVTERRQASR